MSSFKKLNKADVTTVPYAANKRWVLPYTSTPNDGYIVYYVGKNEVFNPSNSTTTNSQYQSLIYSQMNHMFYQSYTGSLDTGSLMFNVDTYQLASQQRPTASYFNYNINPLLIKQFPSGANETIGVLSVNQNIYGSKILPTSFQISSSGIFIKDDGNGNLYDITQAQSQYIDLNYITLNYTLTGSLSAGINFVGNIFYAHGLVVITNQSSSYQNLLTGTTTISFQNEHIVYENEVRCIVKESDYNLSFNPTLLKYGGQCIVPLISGSNSIVSGSSNLYTLTGSFDSTLKDFAQGIKYSPIFDYTRVTDTVVFSTISGSAGGGTRVINPGDPSTTVISGTSIGFNFDFYGTRYTTLNVAGLGNIQFNTADTSNEIGTVPCVSAGPTIFVLSQTYLNYAYTNPDEGVWTKLTGTAGSRIFTVEWKDEIGTHIQAKLYEDTNVIELIYNNFDSFYLWGIGIQNTFTQYNVYPTPTYPSNPLIGTKIVYTPALSYLTESLDFQPYVTTIGLYNDEDELLMVAKLAKPIALSTDTDMTFIVKYDT